MNLPTTISPLDGRYAEDVSLLKNFFNEEGLAEAELLVEIGYLLALSQWGVIRPISEEEKRQLLDILDTLSTRGHILVEIERKIRHDIKAVEYYLRQEFEETSLEDVSNFIHFGLTSNDIYNLAFGIRFKQALEGIILPMLKDLVKQLADMGSECKDYPMLGRTHGQPAVPTTFGKELVNFAIKLHGEVAKLEKMRVPGKLTGVVGNFNAHKAAFPEIDWISFSAEFVSALGLSPKLITTQIVPYEDLCEIFDCLKRINSIIIDLDCDIMDYLSRGYLTLVKVEHEVGSSTMPHKINPIDFERSKANLKKANSELELLSRELPVNLLQRELKDKYLLREVGETLAYGFLSWKATIEGLIKIRADRRAMIADLLEHWEVLAEGIQTILRKHGYPLAYEKLKTLTRGRTLNFMQYRRMLEELMLEIPKEALDEIRELHPLNYLGEAVRLTEKALSEMEAEK